MSETHHAPLGELLVQHGGMSEEHLRAALEEQRASGRPLGEIVVERGYVPAAMVAQALATQQGGLTKTEYGYATGWAQAVDERDRAIAELRRWAERAHAAIASRDAEIERLGGELAAAHAAGGEAASGSELESLQAAVAARDAEIDGLRSQGASIRSEIETAEAALASRDAEIERLGARVPELERDVQELRRQLESESARAVALAADVDEAERLLDGLRRQTASAQSEIEAANALAASLRSEVAAATARADDAERLVAEVNDAAALRRDPWANAESHLKFVRRPDGYELVECDGPPPPAGELVEGGTVQRVSALGGKPCAYLID